MGLADRLSHGIIAAVRSSSSGVVITDAGADDFPIIFANRAFRAITGYDSEEIIGRNCRFLQGQETSGDAISQIRTALHDNVEVTTRLINRRKDSSTFWNELTIIPVRSDDGSVLAHVGLITDVSDEVALRDELDRGRALLADAARALEASRRESELIRHIDPVTDLPTRRHVCEQLDQSLNRSRRGGDKLALVMMNLDGFRQINQRFGYELGDTVLRAAADRMRCQIRKDDVIARCGADEFVLLLKYPVDDEIIAEIVDRIVRAFLVPVDVAGNPASLGISLGTAVFPEDGSDASKLMELAEQRMFQNKRGKRRRNRGATNAA